MSKGRIAKPSFLNPVISVSSELPIVGRTSLGSESVAPESQNQESKATAPKPKKTVPHQSERTFKRVNPVGMRVMAKIKPESDQTDTGLYLPEGAKSEKVESILAEVVEVASAIDEETGEETNISGIPLGGLILIYRDAGVSVPWDEQLRILETADVLALVEELPMT